MLHPRNLQREVRLLGLRTAEQIRYAAETLVAYWMAPLAAPTNPFWTANPGLLPHQPAAAFAKRIALLTLNQRTAFP